MKRLRAYLYAFAAMSAPFVVLFILRGVQIESVFARRLLGVAFVLGVVLLGSWISNKIVDVRDRK